MMVLSRRGMVCAVWMWLGYFGALSAAAQEHRDTTVVGPAETARIIDSLSALSGQDSTATGTDTVTGSSLDSESMEQATTKTDPIVFRSIPNSVITRWKKEKDFAYANDPSYWRKEVPDTRVENSFFRWLANVLGSQGFKYFIYCLLVAILLYAIIRIIAENNLRFFYRPAAKTTAGPGETPDPLEEDLDRELHEALRAKDNRLAVRWLYLKALRLLKDRSLIRYHVDATNREYVRQLGGSAYDQPFRFLTGAYERVWYGQFSLGEDPFQRLHQYFLDFYKSIGQS
ncbi:MAG TPA: DUF4129 domain-containing protein [Puia sp.]